jgi:dihydropyrimidine dehydrogenase (NADP+)
MTPNISDITVCALAAKEGGAAGVTAINTILGIMDFDPVGDPWPKIGSAKYIAAGGMCGDQNRPITSRMIAEARQACGPDFFIMGTGGVSSADSTMQLLRLGASTMQICSAIQNQDYSIVNDYMLGLKTMLYRMGRGDYAAGKDSMMQNNWASSNTSWPGKVLAASDADPHYGDYERKRIKTSRDERVRNECITDECCCKMADITPHQGAVVPVPLGNLVGDRVDRVRQHSDLSRKEQVVAVIVEDLCIQCGKCYMTCNDNAYQAIVFDKDHKARVVTEDCTGCGLCQAVCPVPGCIQYQPMEGVFHPHRGIKPAHDRWEVDGIFL